MRNHFAVPVLLCLLFYTPAGAAAAEKDEEKEEKNPIQVVTDPHAAVRQLEQDKLSPRGADSCLKCHDEFNEYPVLPIFKTKHAQSADPRAPFADLQCESCHGPGNEHSKKVSKGEARPPILNFGADTWVPAEEQNAKCLTCHQNHKRMGWQGSAHEFNNVACASCHKIHVREDPVLQESSQDEVCYACHPRQRAQFHQASTHPVRFGKMTCSECHDVHGGDDLKLLDKGAMRQTCTQCHTEKRGPFLWEHAPAAEDCTLCHQVHGSNHFPLLRRKPPFLCQQCHSQAGHPGVQYDGASRSHIPSRFVALKGCIKCHFQIHGSNHPSGVKLMR